MLYKMSMPGFFTVEMLESPKIIVVVIIHKNGREAFLFNDSTPAEEIVYQWAKDHWHELGTTKKIEDLPFDGVIGYYFANHDDSFEIIDDYVEMFDSE